MTHARWRFVVVAATCAAGCGRTMTDGDCRSVAAHMREVYSAESKKALPPDGVAADKAADVIQNEGNKLIEEWIADCKKELEGRRIDAKEMDCLLKAPSLEAINKCAEL